MSATSFIQPQEFLTLGLSRQVLLEQRAHYMRFHPTPSEALLWSRLRGRRLGVVFRRQVVLGSSIVDFFAPARSLVVEVDGDAYHATRVSADAAREQRLVRAGYTVLRIEASLVVRRLDEAVARVAGAL